MHQNVISVRKDASTSMKGSKKKVIARCVALASMERLKALQSKLIAKCVPLDCFRTLLVQALLVIAKIVPLDITMEMTGNLRACHAK
jgi:hypothetical protein